jgi:hypothetical protein
MVKCGVLFEVRTGSLNTIQTSFGFKGFVPYSSQRTVFQYQNYGLLREPFTLLIPKCGENIFSVPVIINKDHKYRFKV